VRSLLVVARQRGSWVRATVSMGQPSPMLWMTISSLGAHSRVLGSERLRLVRAGRHDLAVRLPKAWRRRLAGRKSTTVVVRVGAISWVGHSALLTRRVVLRG
jgi:hypothetical protein